MPQLWVNYSLYSQLPPLLSCPHFHWHKTCHVFAFFPSVPFQVPPLPKNKGKKKNLIFPSKSFRTIKTLGRFGMAESDMFGAGMDPFFPMGYNKGFILNLDTVQHSFWLEVGRGTSTSHYENSSVHSAWKAATMGKFQSHVSPCWKAAESQHRTTWQRCHVGQSCFEAVSEEASSPGWELKQIS